MSAAHHASATVVIDVAKERQAEQQRRTNGLLPLLGGFTSAPPRRQHGAFATLVRQHGESPTGPAPRHIDEQGLGRLECYKEYLAPVDAIWQGTFMATIQEESSITNTELSININLDASNSVTIYFVRQSGSQGSYEAYRNAQPAQRRRRMALGSVEIVYEYPAWSALFSEWYSPGLAGQWSDAMEREAVNHIIHVLLHHGGARALSSMQLVRAMTLHLTSGGGANQDDKSALDYLLLWAEAAICRPDCVNDDVHVALTFAGIAQCLRRLGRFAEAIDILRECAIQWTRHDVLAHIVALSHIGMTYAAQQDYKMAERYCLAAIYRDALRAESSNDWEVNDRRGTHIVLYNLLAMYATFAVATFDGTSDLEFCMAVLCSLLHATGFEFPAVTGDTVDELVRYTGRNPVLKPCFRTRAAATLALHECVRKATSPASFRYAVLTLSGCNLPLGTNRLRDNGTEVADVVTAFIAETTATDTTAKANCCSNPVCSKTSNQVELQACPCHMVLYCSQTCQRAHWKQHKKSCATKTNDRKANNS